MNKKKMNKKKMNRKKKQCTYFKKKKPKCFNKKNWERKFKWRILETKNNQEMEKNQHPGQSTSQIQSNYLLTEITILIIMPSKWKCTGEMAFYPASRLRVKNYLFPKAYSIELAGYVNIFKNHYDHCEIRMHCHLPNNGICFVEISAKLKQGL